MDINDLSKIIEEWEEAISTYNPMLFYNWDSSKASDAFKAVFHKMAEAKKEEQNETYTGKP